MLDESLPTFYLRASGDGVRHNASVLLSQHGDEAAPAYSIRHPDPALPASRNRYAVALYDSYNPDVLFGEVLLIPEWSQPAPSKEDVRANSGVPPPPQPILPSEFMIQLYNPDQQIHVKWNAGTWHSAPFWEFEMPQQSFRRPSASALDRTQDDPTASGTTPKLPFRWKKEGKLSKDYVCSLSDKANSTEGNKRKNKEPDITVAIFKNWKEVTIYEPNLSRVDIEDPKGFEVVLILGAIVIREVFNTNIREAFNIADTPQASAGPRVNTTLAPQHPPRHHRHSISGIPPSSNYNTSPPNNPAATAYTSRPPPTDPRTQWELDVEAARLRKQVEAEEREQRRADEAETRRVKKMLEEEERRSKEKQKEIDRETERLRKIYGKEEKQSLQQLHERPPPLPARHSHQPTPSGQHAASYQSAPTARPHSAASSPTPYFASNLRPQQNWQEPYLSPNFAGVGPLPTFPYANPPPGPSNQQVTPPKKAFWRTRGGDEGSSRLTKQKSTAF